MIDEWSGKESLLFVELKDPCYFFRDLYFYYSPQDFHEHNPIYI